MKCFIWSFTKRQARGTSSDIEWQRVIASGTRSDNEWQRVVQQVTTIDKEWHWVTKSGTIVKMTQYTSKNGWLQFFL